MNLIKTKHFSNISTSTSKILVTWYIFTTVCLNSCSASLLEGIYCGTENCYDVLNVTRESSSLEVRKAYRNLARIHHPDRHRTEEAKKEAETKFKEIGMSASYNLKQKIISNCSFHC